MQRKPAGRSYQYPTAPLGEIRPPALAKLPVPLLGRTLLRVREVGERPDTSLTWRDMRFELSNARVNRLGRHQEQK